MTETPDNRLAVFGMNLPIIADLGDGYFLVGHPNGPAIATESSLYALDCAVDAELPKEGTLPYEVRRSALQKYREWSWPLVKAHLDFAN